MRLEKPKRYPHVPRKHYTMRGFTQRVIPNICREYSITQKEAKKLMRLYFARGYTCHIDNSGAYRNNRQFRLYYLGRELGKDRKKKLFDLVELSKMFYVYYDDDDNVAAFVSPWVIRHMGIIPYEMLAC